MWIDESTQKELGWLELKQHLATHARTPQGRKKCLELTPTTDHRWVEIMQNRCRRLSGLFDQGASSPLEQFDEIENDLIRAQKGGVLQSEGVRRVGHVMQVTSRVRRFLLNQADVEGDELVDLARGSMDLSELGAELLDAFEADGRLRDSASPELARLRKKVRALTEGIRSRLERLMHRPGSALFLREPYITQRGDRYVLPIRADAPEPFPGIVHDTSQSGATLFIEPAEMVDEGNRLKIFQAAVLDEEMRILSGYSEEIARQTDSLRNNLETAAQFDLIAAAVELGRKYAGRWLELGSKEIELRDARHPLMALALKQVVPNDIRMSSQHSCLVITGPNAGGKTVTLKCVGLMALMTQAGLPVPVAEGSRIGCFTEIWALIGDAQDIDRGLSTFSAHISGLAGILQHARAGSLVLLDELAADTEPRHGAALACAVCQELVEMGATTLVSTHYEELKRLPFRNERIVNVSVGFDSKTMEPTYQLHPDVPGRSLTFDIARRLRIPESVLREAGSYLDHSERDLDRMLENLDMQKQAVAELRDELAGKIDDYNRRNDRLERQLEVINTEKNQLIQSQSHKVLAEISDVRQEIAGWIEKLKHHTTMKTAVEASHAVKDLAKRAESLGASPSSEEDRRAAESVESDGIQVGDKVFLKYLGKEGRVVSVDVKAGVATVRLGANMRTRVAVEQLKRIRSRRSDRDQNQKNRQSTPPKIRVNPPGSASSLVVRSIDNTIDLRGLRVDEAIDWLEKFLDKAFGRSEHTVFIVHGHGTGALRSRLRDYLRTSPYPHHFRTGTPEEGGDGVTVVKLK